VFDAPGGARFTDRLYIGAAVTVRADATIYPDPTVSVVADPGFETAAAGSTVSVIRSNAAPVKVTATRAHTGTHAARIDPAAGSTSATRVRVIFPPAPLSPTHDPAAWGAHEQPLLDEERLVHVFDCLSGL